MCEFKKTLKILILDGTSFPESTAENFFQEIIGDITRATEGWSIDNVRMIDNNKLTTNFNKKYMLVSDIAERTWEYWYE